MESNEKSEEKTDQNEKVNIEKEKLTEQNNIENILGDCSKLTPLKFVDTTETLYHTIVNKVIYGSLCSLSSYKKTHIINYHLIDFKLKTLISSKLLKKMNDINCIKVTQDLLFTGEKNGNVYMYQIEKGLEVEGFGVNGFNSPVSAIENKGNDYLLVGYENGTINLFDIKKVALIKSINEIHKTKILALKSVSIEKNNFKVISADEEGQVMYINSSNTLLNKKTTGTIIFKDAELTYSITKFRPYEDKKLTLLGFGCTNKVRIYSLEPKISPITEIKKPKFAEKNDIPDMSLGWGVRPVEEGISQKKLSEKKRKKEILLAIGWGNIISLYGFLIKGDNIKIEGPIGFYQNNCAIIRLGFFAPSIIYFFDKNSQIKVINTSFCNYGKCEEIQIYDNKNALIDEGVNFSNIKYNIITKTNEKEYHNYRNFIYNMKKSIYLFTNEGLNVGKILNYEECIENIIKNGNNWNSALCLGIDIYKGNIINIMDTPLEEKERKEKLFPYLKQKLNQYIDYIFSIKSDLTSDNELISSSNENTNEIKEERIIECINIIIEFCIEINAIDYLLKDVEKTFTALGKGDLFYKLLEPYIFNDILLKENIGLEGLTSLYGSYKIKNELILLSHLFTHINLKNLNNIIIKKLAVQENIFNLIIFIFSNGECSEDFFLPISKMFIAYSKAVKKEHEEKEKEKEKETEVKENNNEKEYNYFSYYDLFVKRGIKGINEMEVCKEYIGHKLLWYIEMCLKGNKFASGIEVELLKFETNTEKYKKFISYIYFWILQEKIFKVLLEFDSYSFFSVLILFFTESKIIKIIQNYDFSTINADLMEQLIKEQEDNTYFMKNMKNTLKREYTMAQEEKKNENKINESIKSSKTIIPGNSNMDILTKENEKLVEIKEEDEQKEKEETKEEKGKNEQKNLNEKEEKKEKEEKAEIAPKKEQETPKVDKEKDKKEKELFDPFASSNHETKFGKGVKLNDLNSVLDYIIKLVESQPSDLSHLDLDTFLIKYASKTNNPIPDKLRKKILQGFINLLKYFADYRSKRKDLIAQKSDKFNIHNLSKKTLGPKDPYFINISNLLSDLINSKDYKFNDEELYKLESAATRTQFTVIKIKIAELSKKYGECLDIFIKQENQKLKENVFTWMEEKFQFFIESINEEKNRKENETEEKGKNISRINEKDSKENKLNNLEKNYENFTNAIIIKIFELAKIRTDKTKRIVGKYFDNTQKLKVYNRLSGDPQIQFEFLEQLLYQPIEQMNEEDNLNDNIDDEQKRANCDIFKLYVKNKKHKNSIREEKKNREEFDKLMLDQIHLLIVLKRRKEIINYLEKNIKQYLNYPLREALRKCVENDITDSAVYLYQTLGENRSALKYTKDNLEKSFKKFISNANDNKDFLDKLQVCINICIQNSESLMKKEVNEKGKKYNEGEELWFDLLKNLYDFEDKLEAEKEIDENNKKIIQITLQKAIEDLLREMCSYVSIQKLVEYATDKQKRAQYKEFKSILESMLRSNTSFDRVLNNVRIILKDSIENSESVRKKVTSRGNNYDYKKCDVCRKNYRNSKEEIIYLFGCGHQSHEKCCYKRKLNNDNKNIIFDGEEEESFLPECELCRRNKIEKKNNIKYESEDENIKKIQNVINEDMEEIKTNQPSDKKKEFKFGNKKDKLKKIAKYDKSYQNEISMFY